ncbi:isocitrate lyase/phosphoenolpyruvate mutase family protein [Amycolatopsis sp. NPDC089917]|uniref:isocitrate lyase/phosphoenolpyruvate mutase family protein n=1 Tax=Amycolatopsis sp. NPDC089917 TaxID=3155187 RepID=UPI00343004B1
MKRQQYPSFRTVLNRDGIVRVAGAHDALGAVLAQESGFDAIWSSSLEISAGRCLPDFSLLTMTELLAVAADMQKALRVPVVADCETGYGNALNVAHMVHQYQAAGISAVCLEDKLFPKANSFAVDDQPLMDAVEFAHKIEVAKATQDGDDFLVIARTEALISGLSVAEALTRAHTYVDAGADAVLIHSKARTEVEVMEFLHGWRGRRPVVVVPTTYPNWHIDKVRAAGVSVVIYANQGLRATITALRSAFRSILKEGSSQSLEGDIASMSEVFSLQRNADWRKIDNPVRAIAPQPNQDCP